MPETPSKFAEQISAAIKNTPHLGQRELQCVVHEGRVVLKGVVGSYFQKQMAQEAVLRVDGVKTIDNELEVNWN